MVAQVEQVFSIKQGKPFDKFSSFRPITISPVLCTIFEPMIIDKITTSVIYQIASLGEEAVGCDH